ncbi:unnamed protein product, partial [Cyprideis torosa]
MRLDLDTIVAGLLHGVLKDGITVEELEDHFGQDVSLLVKGATRITDVKFNSELAEHADNVRKMLLAISKDIRVLLLRLADRLQDMCELDRAEPKRQRKIAKETMDIYTPLASRLGIDWLKRELEDLSFKYLYPVEYNELNEKLESSLEERQRYVDEVINILRHKLAEFSIHPIRIFGRPKHLYSIHKKLIAQKIPLERVYDKVAFRIIVETVRECYETVGVIHSTWSPVKERIKDFIARPKANNYQSMHTTVLGPRGHFIEIQIRTEEMDLVAQEGIAAHWAYKEGQRVNQDDMHLFGGLKKLVQSLQKVEDPREFLLSVREELDQPEVYALTPNGEVKELPGKSSPLDFAYAIHSEIGDTCVGAKVNGRMVPLKYELQDGDIVEIVTSPNQTPRRGWLALVKTRKARERIRSWLRREEKKKALGLGREICERELKQNGTTLKKIVKTGHVRLLLKKLHCNSLDDMLVKVGNGTITVQQLEKVLLPPEAQREQEGLGRELELESGGVFKRSGKKKKEEQKDAITIDGADDLLIKISKCCSPVPGDEIIGFITMGRGVSIHRTDCINLRQTDPNRWLDVEWR